MEYRHLGDSELNVSSVCMGTMVFGEQVDEPLAHQLLDDALARGVNFFDAAEMYPVPSRPETQGRTEQFVGEWLKRQDRSKVILATKVAGPHRNLSWMRNGPAALDRANITEAVNNSLQRLQTDYIDLYQIHWPDRSSVPSFGRPATEPVDELPQTPVAEQLQVFDDLIKAGKIRYVGLSNETPWGVMEYVRLAKHMGLPKVISIQNAYSLINRTFEMGLAEISRRENVPLLAYSPLGFGLLTGKYLDGQGSGRLTQFPAFGQRYQKPYALEATAAYAALAHAHGLSPAQLAIAFVKSQWFVGSTIIGATNREQLQENLDAFELTLSPELLAAIDAIHARYPNPAP